MRVLSMSVVVLLMTTGACSSVDKKKEKQQEALKDFARKPEVQSRIAKARTHAQLSQRTPQVKILYDMNGRWRSDLVETDRHLELSFGMDGVVVVELVSPRGSTAFSQGKFSILQTGQLNVTLASPPSSLKGFATFTVSPKADRPEMLIGDRKIRIYRM